MSARKAIGVGLIVAILSLAVYLSFFRNTDELEQLPDTKESATLWYCPECNHAFELTAREARAAIDAGVAEPVEGVARSRIRIHCPKCRDPVAYRAKPNPDGGPPLPLGRGAVGAGGLDDTGTPTPRSPRRR